MVSPTPFRIHRLIRNRYQALCRKQPFVVKRDAVPHDVVTGPGQLVRQGLPRHHGFPLGRLSLVEFPGAWIVPYREIGRFDEGPGEILVAALGVPFALLFPLLMRSLLTVRQYEEKSPTVGNRPMSPVSRAMFNARMSPMPGTVFSILNSGRSFALSFTTFSILLICSSTQ